MVDDGSGHHRPYHSIPPTVQHARFENPELATMWSDFAKILFRY